MSLSHWFQDQLQASAEGFIWAAQQVPQARRLLQPPKGLGKWTTARHIFHMVYYEKTYALPSMRQWLGEPCPSIPGLGEKAAWGKGTDNIESLLADYKVVRTDQVALLPLFDDPTWNKTCETIWGLVTLSWVVSKTYQHTAEHTSDVMRIALFWDMYVEWHKSKNSGLPA